MKSRKAWIAISALLLAVVVVIGIVATRSRRSTIVIHNASASELRNVIISGHGFRVSCGSLRPGQSATLNAQVSGDTGIAVTFEAAGRQVSVPEQGYAGGGGYRVMVEVSPEFSVSVQSSLVA